MNQIVPHREDSLWAHTTSQWLTDYGILSAIGLVCLIMCYVGLARRGRR